jgi:hypothetical protein
MKDRPLPNSKRAITNGKIATIHQGRRVVNIYKSGQPLIGEVADADTPPLYRLCQRLV